MQHKVYKKQETLLIVIFVNYAIAGGGGKDYCDMHFTHVDVLDNAVIDILKQIRLNKNMIDDFSVKDDNLKLVSRSKNDVQREIEKAEAKILNLTNALSNSTGSSATKYIVFNAFLSSCVTLPYSFLFYVSYHNTLYFFLFQCFYVIFVQIIQVFYHVFVWYFL